ncbi:hypothetical protein NEHOM01_0685 [Nematocida homosporus]|uniref:uncharacterized protein n=1 Tax=Nematocida homosporus TaxID=1912981 RepID=UPI002221210A|nr:uncharacterized protein NEHOM01_0685 [Nematocida homosporus]KAI5185227.1 hypothetical protein NEHOM01_0685 [Nematocida homosporus]
MTVLIDTYGTPAWAIMSQLYQTMCYEVLLEEVYSRSYNAPKDGKKYTVLQDISPKVLLAVRDVESIIYVIHQEMLSEKEYKILKHYTNELIYVDQDTIRVHNKKTQKHEAYQISKIKDSSHRVKHLLTQIEVDKKPSTTPGAPLLTEEQKKDKAASLPFLQAQGSGTVYFPDEELSEDSDILEDQEECS